MAIIMPAVARTLSQIYPADSRIDEAGRIEVGGCDLVALVRERGTPAYVYAESDMRARAREYLDSFRAGTTVEAPVSTRLADGMACRTPVIVNGSVYGSITSRHSAHSLERKDCATSISSGLMLRAPSTVL